MVADSDKILVIKGPLAKGARTLTQICLDMPMTFNITVNGIGVYTPDSFPNSDYEHVGNVEDSSDETE